MSKSYAWEVVVIDAALLGTETSLGRVRRVIEEVERSSPDVQMLYLAYDDRELDLAPSQDTSVVLCDRKRAAEAILSFYSEAKGVQPGVQHATPWMWLAGKRILWLRRRRSPFISYFQPPKGVVCRRFPKLAVANGCPYSCAYCYLQLTLRMQPFVSLFLNLEELESELPRWEEKPRGRNGRLLLNLGELGDAVEPFPWLMGVVISAVARHAHLGVLLLTKSERIRQVPELGPWTTLRAEPQDEACSVSLTTPENAALFERDAPPPEERLEGLAEVARETKVEAVRVRLDPIIPWGNWQGGYAALVGEIAKELGDELELVTLGQLRFTPALLPFVVDGGARGAEGKGVAQSPAL